MASPACTSCDPPPMGEAKQMVACFPLKHKQPANVLGFEESTRSTKFKRVEADAARPTFLTRRLHLRG